MRQFGGEYHDPNDNASDYLAELWSEALCAVAVHVPEVLAGLRRDVLHHYCAAVACETVPSLLSRHDLEPSSRSEGYETRTWVYQRSGNGFRWEPHVGRTKLAPLPPADAALVEALREALYSWADTYGLNDPRALNTALNTLANWAIVQKLPWELASQLSGATTPEQLGGWWHLPKRSQALLGEMDPERETPPAFRYEHPGWRSTEESFPDYAARIKAEVEAQLKELRESQEEQADLHGWEPTTVKLKQSTRPDTQHFRWWALHRCGRWEYSKIERQLSKEHPRRRAPSVASIGEAVRGVDALLGFPLKGPGRPSK